MTYAATKKAQLGITPYLQVNNTGDAIAWYKRVFAATEKRARLVTPDGACMNAEIVIAGTLIMLADEAPGIDSKSPLTLHGTSVVLNLRVAPSLRAPRRCARWPTSFMATAPVG